MLVDNFWLLFAVVFFSSALRSNFLGRECSSNFIDFRTYATNIRTSDYYRTPNPSHRGLDPGYR